MTDKENLGEMRKAREKSISCRKASDEKEKFVELSPVCKQRTHHYCFCPLYNDKNHCWDNVNKNYLKDLSYSLPACFIKITFSLLAYKFSENRHPN